MKPEPADQPKRKWTVTTYTAEEMAKRLEKWGYKRPQRKRRQPSQDAPGRTIKGEAGC